MPRLGGSRLEIIGDGPERAAVEQRAEAVGVADRVRFLGKVPRAGVLAALGRAQAVVIPSHVGADGDMEGTPVVLSEAMAAGVPVVASKLGGLAECLSDGVDGLLVPPDDVDALVATLDKLLSGGVDLDAIGRAAVDTAGAAARRRDRGRRVRPGVRRARRGQHLRMIGVLHAYSRTNSGDGLLVDLTLDRLGRARRRPVGGRAGGARPRLVPRGAAPGGDGRGAGASPGSWCPLRRGATAVGASAVVRSPIGSVAAGLASCEAFVAVGGGYLRAVDVTSSVGTALNHLPQLLAAGRADVPTLYLPQSIGPLRARWARRCVAASTVSTPCACATLERRRPRARLNVHHLPDLAVLDLAEHLDRVEPADPGGRVGFVARVGHAPGYEAEVQAVSDGLRDGAVWAVQTGRPHEERCRALRAPRPDGSARGCPSCRPVSCRPSCRCGCTAP